MKPGIIIRTIAALVLGVLFGVSMYHGEAKHTALSRDEFLKQQADYFDRQHAEPLMPATAIARGVASAGFAVGLYELIAFGVLKLFRIFEKKDRRSRSRSGRQF
ncbi:MAG TPA: hypothetical protein VME24_03285 [Alphaproteobacteria bacterium]|nr:hypothetical protein [Alphaproteobacteria bacterium]